MTATDLAERYGSPAPWRRRALVAACVAVALVFLGWLAWTALFHASPEASSRLTTYEIVDDHTATARVDVSVEDGADATCRVRALAADHTTVGEVGFVPVDGRNEVTIRTERRASSVESVGCTTADQPRAR